MVYITRFSCPCRLRITDKHVGRFQKETPDLWHCIDINAFAKIDLRKIPYYS